jgi:hypothetical protein
MRRSTAKAGRPKGIDKAGLTVDDIDLSVAIERV